MTAIHISVMRSSVALVVMAAVFNAAGIGRCEIPRLDDAPRPLSPDESAARMRLPDGFTIELAASEPLLADPSCVAFDERGRVFASELHGYNLEGQLDIDELNKSGELDTSVRRVRVSHEAFLKARQQMTGAVKLLKDTDQDGRFDAVDVWCDDLPPCYGIVAARGGIIAACAPDIVYLADRDNDGRAEIREVLFTGFTITVMERAINNPRWGPDNWIYVGEGGGGGTITGPNLKQPFRLGETDFRIKPDGSAIEAVNGSVGTFGLTVTDFGDRFIANGGRPADYALPLPYGDLARNPHVPSPRTQEQAVAYTNVFRISRPHPWRVRRAADARWVEFYGKHETSHDYYSAGCGNELYRANLFGDDFRDNLFFCEPSQNIIHRCIIRRDGAGYRGERAPGNEMSEFLASSDPWFGPVNTRVGPDGALYIVDIYREIIEDYSAIPRHLQQQYGLMNGSDRGRLWRLAPKNRPRRPSQDLAVKSSAELVQLLDDGHAWWRLTAQRLLVERQDASTAGQLRAMAQQATTPQGRLAALYTLDGLGLLQTDDVLAALDDDNYGLRFHALQFAGRWLKSDERLVTNVSGMVHDPDPRVRLHVALALGDAPGRQATEALAELAHSHGHERWMPAAILSASADRAGDLFALLIDEGEDRDRTQGLLGPLAATVGGRRDPQQLARLLGAVAEQDAALQHAVLQGLLPSLSSGKPMRMETAPFGESVEKLLASRNVDVRNQTTQLAARLGMHHVASVRAIFDEAIERALNENAPPEDRRQAVLLLASAPFEDLAATAGRLLDPRHPPGLQAAAVQSLSAANEPQVAALLFAGWNSYTPDIRRHVLDAIFAQSNRLPALVDALEQKLIRPAELDALGRQQLVQHPDAKLAARAERLLNRDGADAELAARIERYEQALADARQPELGREIFVKHCSACHQIGGEGHAVGPPLAPRLNRPDEALLADLLDPSREITSGFQSYVVTTQNGRIYHGVLESDTATGITLRREAGRREEILRKDIDTIHASAISMMPSNLHEQVSPQDAAHLLSYLREALRP